MKILFVCLGNICRSSTAQGIMEELIRKNNAGNWLEVDSAGILSYHQGELPDTRMRSHAARRGYHLTHLSRPVIPEDFDEFDMIMGMDDRNIEDLKAKAPDTGSLAKIYRMTDFCRHIQADHVPDPYYGGSSGFERVLDILEDACEGLMVHLKDRK